MNARPAEAGPAGSKSRALGLLVLPRRLVLAASWFPGTGLSVNGCPVGTRESGAERWWLVDTATCPQISTVLSPRLAEGASGTKQGRNELSTLSCPCCFPRSAACPSPPFPGPWPPAWPQVRAPIEDSVLGADLLLSDSLHPRILILWYHQASLGKEQISDSHWLPSLQRWSSVPTAAQ